MNEFVERFKKRYGDGWVAVLNRRYKLGGRCLKEIEPAVFMWGRETAEMLGFCE